MSFRPEDLPEGAINTKEIDGLWKYFASVSVDDIEGGPAHCLYPPAGLA